MMLARTPIERSKSAVRQVLIAALAVVAQTGIAVAQGVVTQPGEVVAQASGADPGKPNAPVNESSSASPSTLDQAFAAYRAAQEASTPTERAAAFARAERLFAASAADSNGSAALWTNVGTAALQAQHVGNAILAYRRALALDPDNRHAQQNLTHARTLLPAWVPRPENATFFDSFLARQHSLSTAERCGAGALAFALACAMLGGAIATGSTALRLFAIVPLAAWAMLVASEFSGSTNRGAVIAAADTLARAADSRNAPARFAEPLPAGTEVTIAEVRGDWSRVVLADGRDAWVSTSAVEMVDSTLR